MDYGRDWENDHFFSEGSECAEEIEEQKEVNSSLLPV